MGCHLRHFIYNIDCCCYFLKITYTYTDLWTCHPPKDMYVHNIPQLFIKVLEVPMFYTTNFHEFHHKEFNGLQGASLGTFNYKFKRYTSPYIEC